MGETSYKKVYLAVSLTCIYTVTILSIATLKAVDGTLPYNTSSLVLFVESVKCLISLYFLFKSPSVINSLSRSPCHDHEHHGLTTIRGGIHLLSSIKFKSFLLYAIPGLCFSINNNMYYLILANMRAANFQMLQNIRVVMTGVTFRYVLQRMLSTRQWIASFILLFGCMLGQYHTSSSSNPSHLAGDEVSWFAYGLVAVYLCISVLASVYCELLLKNEPNLHFANVQLYTWGVIFSMFGLIYQGIYDGHFFKGWELPHTWVQLH